MANSTSVGTGALLTPIKTIFDGKCIINGYTVSPGVQINIYDGAKLVDSFNNTTGTESVHVNYRQALRCETSLRVENSSNESPVFVFWGAS